MPRGTSTIPTDTRPTRNASSRPADPARTAGDRPPPVDSAVSAAISRMAMRSSATSTPSTSSRRWPVTRWSSNARAMMVVLEMATMAPANRLTPALQPNACPRAKPHHSMTLVSMTAVRPALGPMAMSLRRLNDRPIENISRMMPSSESVTMTARSAASGLGR